MGLFSTTSYLGMTTLPFIAGLFADIAGFFAAFCLTAFFAILVAFTIGDPSRTRHHNARGYKKPIDSSAIKGNFVMRL